MKKDTGTSKEKSTLKSLKEQRDTLIKEIKKYATEQVDDLKDGFNERVEDLKAQISALSTEMKEQKRALKDQIKAIKNAAIQQVKNTVTDYKIKFKEEKQKILKDTLLEKGFSEEIVDGTENIHQLKAISPLSKMLGEEVGLDMLHFIHNKQDTRSLKHKISGAKKILKAVSKLLNKTDASKLKIAMMNELEKASIDDSLKEQFMQIKEEDMQKALEKVLAITKELKIVELIETFDNLQQKLSEDSASPSTSNEQPTQPETVEEPAVEPAVEPEKEHVVGPDSNATEDTGDTNDTTADIAYTQSQKVLAEIGVQLDLPKEDFMLEVAKMVARAHPELMEGKGAMDEITTETASEYFEQHLLDLNPEEMSHIIDDPSFAADLQDELGPNASAEEFFAAFEHHVFDSNGELIDSSN